MRIAVLIVFVIGFLMGQRNVGVAEDRFYTEPFQSLNLDTKSLTLRTQTLNPAVRNLVIIAAGQSNMADVGPSAHSPSNGSVLDQLNIYDGAIYAAADPLLGTSYPRSAGVAIYGPGNHMLRLADSFVTAGLFDRVVIVPVGVGATRVDQFEPGSYGGKIIPVALRRLAALGIVAGANVTITILWGQGESDTDAGTSQAAYTASLNNIIATSRAEGFTGLWFVALMSRSLGSASAAVVAAQAAVVDHGANVWAGPNLDALNGNNCSAMACRQADDTHFSDAGMASAAAAWKTAMALYGAPF